MTKFSRRLFLKGGAATGFASMASTLGMVGAQKAWAADTTGYKALVCVFFLGGLDHADTILPFDEASFDQLASVRPGLFGQYGVGSGNSSRDRVNMMELTIPNADRFGGRQFALPLQLAGLHSLFESGEAAIIGNVGPLIEPTSRETFEAGSVLLPPRLFSHNDQQSTWMALDVEGQQVGWGGRFADAIIEADPSADPTFAAIATSGNQVFLSGETARQFSAFGGGSSLDVLRRRILIGRDRRYDSMRNELAQFFEQSDFGQSNLFSQDVSMSRARGIQNAATFGDALETIVPFGTEFPGSQLGNQLEEVARTIEARNVLGVNRQIFFCAIGGFDTHDGQVNGVPGLHNQISGALMAFRNAMIERGIWQDVTVFTASDFGRTTIDNGDGTDHGWGGHHFVLGGSVNGGDIYGDIPSPDLTSQYYTPTRGRLIPSVSVEQYAATLGRWFGLNDAELLAALPNLGQFGSGDLGFMSGSGT
ncbi:MAG: DUF1501 domain-containing protein [Pseudomonadota bacterium]